MQAAEIDAGLAQHARIATDGVDADTERGAPQDHPAGKEGERDQRRGHREAEGDRRVHEGDEAHVVGDRRGVGQRDRKAPRPDPGGERDDQRIEPEAADDEAVEGVDRDAGGDARRERKRQRHAGLTGEGRDHGAEGKHRSRRDVDRARNDADHRADGDDGERGVLLDERDDDWARWRSAG